MIVLRDYQQKIIEDLRDCYKQGVRAPLLVSPTGSGKTVMFASMTHDAAARNKRIWICAHRVELLDQIGKALQAFDVPYGEISPRAKSTNHAVQVASVFTLAKRYVELPKPDLIIMDEAHHCVSTTTWGRVMAAYPQTRVLGVTATPERMNGQGLGEMFGAMIMGPTTGELIASGSLSRYELYRPPSTLDLKGVKRQAGDYAKGELDERVRGSSIMGDAVSHYIQHCPGKRALAFCVSVRHAEEVAAAFNHRGVPAASIDGTMTPEMRKRLVEALGRGEIKVLTSCDLISEGFDCPAIEAAFLLRPTQSLALYLQQVGRGLRIAPGKDKTIIFDHAGNSKKHGLPDDDRDWDLQGFAARRSKDKATPVKTCKHCYAVIRLHLQVCPHCGFALPAKDHELEVVAGQLEKIDPELARMSQQKRRIDQGRSKSMDELIALGKQRGYPHPQAWAYHVFRSRQKA